MSQLQWSVRLIDRLFRSYLNPNGYDAFAHNDIVKPWNQLNDASGKAILATSSSVDTKSAALLTHVSIMIAVSGLLFANEQNWIFSIIYGLEIICYMLLAAICLRLMLPDMPNEGTKFAAEVGYRTQLLGFASKLTIVLSLTLIALVGLEAITLGFGTLSGETS